MWSCVLSSPSVQDMDECRDLVDLLCVNNHVRACRRACCALYWSLLDAFFKAYWLADVTEYLPGMSYSFDVELAMKTISAA